MKPVQRILDTLFPGNREPEAKALALIDKVISHPVTAEILGWMARNMGVVEIVPYGDREIITDGHHADVERQMLVLKFSEMLDMNIQIGEVATKSAKDGLGYLPVGTNIETIDMEKKVRRVLKEVFGTSVLYELARDSKELVTGWVRGQRLDEKEKFTYPEAVELLKFHIKLKKEARMKGVLIMDLHELNIIHTNSGESLRAEDLKVIDLGNAELVKDLSAEELKAKESQSAQLTISNFVSAIYPKDLRDGLWAKMAMGDTSSLTPALILFPESILPGSKDGDFALQSVLGEEAVRLSQGLRRMFESQENMSIEYLDRLVSGLS